LTSCDDTFFGNDDGTNINPADLAADITNFINDNFGGYNIQSVHFEDICEVQYYEVELEDGPGPDVDLYFTMDEQYAFMATDIASAALPQPVLEAIAQNFSGYTIDDDKVKELESLDGSLQFEVELQIDGEADLEIVFNSDGSIFCQHNSGSDDSNDDNGNDDNSGNSSDDNNSADLTDEMKHYIQNNYPGYKVESVHLEDVCDVNYYEVELEDGPGPDIELYFNLDKTFAFAVTEISQGALPQAVLDAIAKNFSNYEIDDDKVQKFELADGSLQFEVELEQDSGSDLEIVFNADGSIFCQKTDD
jgi:uncharacterized membrane protein YkoI